MATLKMGSTTVLTDTTLANAVQDNVTRLGTVTAGNLSHADIVYPAGHIIQVASDELTGTGSTASATYQTMCTATFATAPLSGSKVICLGHAWVSSNWGGCAVTIFRGSTNLADSLGSINDYGSWNQYSFANGADEKGEAIGINVVDPSPAGATSYYLKYASINGSWNPVYYGRAQGSSSGYARGSQHLTILEVTG